MLKDFLIGNDTDTVNRTGVTVILCPKGAVGGVSVRGGAPATHETDLLRSENTVEKLNAVVLAGGSAFGLESIAGVMQYLAEQGFGYDAGGYRVPICSGAAIYDLECGSFAYPDKAAGYRAASKAERVKEMSGRIGAGTGATVAKMAGMAKAIPSGMAVTIAKKGELEIAVVTVVNALGNIYDPSTGQAVCAVLPEESSVHANTTISCVITNAKLTKAQANKLADTAQDAYARCIRPVHTPYDGDSIFVMSSGEYEASFIELQMMAEELCEKAILRAVKANG